MITGLLSAIRQWLGGGPKLIEMVDVVFPDKDRAFALQFYESWSDRDYLSVELGDGSHELYDQNDFFTRAWFFFFQRPIATGQFWILGADAEDESGTIVLKIVNGAIYYAYGEIADDETLTELAIDFPNFVDLLNKAGWAGP